ncbi:MAG TPA: hypothetical protein VF719_02685 [Abditibacteriaceae bacterium]|jgi:hypothetical protein
MNKIKSTFSLCCLSVVLTLAQQLQANQVKPSRAPAVASPDDIISLDSWVYSAFDKMEDIQGILGCSLFMRKKSQAYSRYDCAIFTLRLRGRTDWRYVENFPQGKSLGEAGVRDIIAAFEREFEPEITQICAPSPK